MTPSARPLDAAAAAIVVMLCLTWGFNQVAVKLTIHEIPPLIQAAIRSAGAALIVMLWIRVRGIVLTKRDGTLLPGLIAGLLFTLEFLLIYRGLLLTTASRAVLFIYLAPVFVALGARFLLPGERMGALQWTGLALSFLGLAIAFGVPSGDVSGQTMIGDLMMIAAAGAWASTTLVIKTSALARTSAEKTMLYQLVVSAPLLAIAALLFHEAMPQAPSTLAIVLLAFQTIWVVSVTFLIWFAMVVRYSASRLSAFTFLTPLFGVLAGHLVLDEPMTPAFAAAVALVAGGLILVNRPAR
ncbi:MAG TPA: DMT family transporter [Xanthobacteraceae bacterium]|jgi:drug/metabolite transporter (DMT)-like permease|nr:DMT family transporter [Xanthobacteraceae bacterium]